MSVRPLEATRLIRPIGALAFDAIRVAANNSGMQRRALLAVLIASLTLAPGLSSHDAALGAKAAREAPLARKLARALTLPGLERARSAALALDMRTGQVVYAANATRPLAPASVEKLTVTYAALVALGPAFRFHTEVLARGTQAGKTWHGDLVVRGYGDPTLSSADLARLARDVRAAGIRVVRGRVLGDEAFFDARRTAPGWKSYYYRYECAPLSALIADRAVFRGTITPWPAAAAAAVFKRELEARGVKVMGRARATRAPIRVARLLGTVESPPLWKVLRFMDHESDNLTAELVLKQLGALFGRAGATAAGAAVVHQLLGADGIPLDGVKIVDGSGLSRLDRLTAKTLTRLLQAAWSSPQLRKAFLAVLPVAGRNGTLSSRLRGRATRGRVSAKTGTTLISSALAGYVNARYAFAILNNGSPVDAWRARMAQDRFVTVLARAG